jgi:phosphoribosylformylglycinamidine cyclo-ligase
VETSGLTWESPNPFGDGTLGQALLAPTRLYVKQCLAAIRAGGVHGFAHITGGGLTENIPRALNEGQGLEIDLDSWELPAIFKWLSAQGNMEPREMLKTFNCGIGMTVIVDAASVDAVREALIAAGEEVVELGRVTDTAGVVYTGTL